LASKSRLTILRFGDNEVLNNINGVLTVIKKIITFPLPQGRGEGQKE
jgi:very-short-patch-repair endonuclease